MRTASIFVVVMLSTTVSAAPITGLFNTAVDGAGTVLAGGAVDPHYEVLGIAPARVITSPAGSWLANDVVSKWIWQNASGQPTNVIRTFRTTVDLTGFNPATVAISGRWSTDNFGDDIILNGVSTGQTKGGFTTWGPFSLNSGFIAGVNTIDFVIRDVGVISGFRAEFLSAEGVLIPLPPAIVLFSFGLAGIWRLNVGARSRANRRQPFFIAKAPVPPHSRR